ncbi:MAG: nucleoside recognition protein [Desulfobacterales bacterium]|nr:nucleoside recognition protein [Desulfobacterales bacterium]
MAKHPKGKSNYKKLVVSLGVTALMMAAGFLFVEGVTLEVVLFKIGKPLLRLMGFISIGLVVGQIIESTGWTRYLALAAGPLFRFAGMGERCSAAFVTAFVSGVSSNAMLYGFYQDGSISRKQLYVANLINQFPAYFLHLPTTFFIVVPLVGRAGLVYFGLTFVALLLRTALVVFYGHVSLGGEKEGRSEVIRGKSPMAKGFDAVIQGVKKRFFKRVAGVATWVIPIYVAVFFVHRLGFFDFMNESLAHLAVSRIMPVESLSVIVLGFTAEFSSGFAAAGALLEAGVLTIKQTALALVIGNIVAFPIRAIRHQLPRYAGIFSPVMGTQILLLGQFLRIGSLMVTAVLFYLLAA